MLKKILDDDPHMLLEWLIIIKGDYFFDMKYDEFMDKKSSDIEYKLIQFI